jgi:hypothetical protein
VDYNTDGDKAATLPELSDYRFENIVINGIKHDVPYHIRVKGFDEGTHAAKNILLKNVHCLNVDKKTALNIVNCDNLVMENVTFEK